MITASELIEQLQQHPGDMRVIMPGYEGGFVDVAGMERVNIKLNCNTEWYYGPHKKRAVTRATKPRSVLEVQMGVNLYDAGTEEGARCNRDGREGTHEV